MIQSAISFLKQTYGRTIGRARTYRQDQRGISAVEFAFIAPVLLLIYMSCVEVNLMLRADRRVTATAAALGDLTARLNTATNADFRELYDAATVMMQPYRTSQTRMRLTSIVDTGDGQKRVAWSEGHNMPSLAVGTVMNVPDGIVQQPGSVILAEIEFDYTSQLGFLSSTPMTLKDRFYLRPRRVQTIDRVQGPPGSIAFGPSS
ncbi:TadE/TadG family type IV pilus assembly protein [Hyphomonas sp.]|uniref:TadE/TadG family type IV pilus assembly protein n=1 Tax=Hyphomonas sp. TaxID=87 RepID=UPI00391A4C6F